MAEVLSPEARTEGSGLSLQILQAMLREQGGAAASMTGAQVVESYERLHRDGWIRVVGQHAYLSRPDRPDMLVPMGTLDLGE